MIPGLGGGLALGGGSSEAKSSVDSTLGGASGFTVNASKGIDAKTALVLAIPVVALLGLALVLRPSGGRR